MKTYSLIASLYEKIFPFKPQQYSFLKEGLQNSLENKRVLDIGCATGALSYEVATNGATVIGIDFDEEMIVLAKENYKSAEFHNLNMLNRSFYESNNDFDLVSCFGNTLVHVNDTDKEIFFSNVFLSLKADGLFQFQILNYDKIVAEKLSFLPIIENQDISFIREYEYHSNMIDFHTKLFDKKSGKKTSSCHTLFPIGSETIVNMLTSVGFKDIKLFGNYKRDEFDGTSMPLIVECKK